MAAARDHFSSRLGVLAATLGSAVGLGNIWKFPALVGQNGGASFLLVYVLATLCVGLPLMIAELAIGRAGRRNVVDVFRVIAPRSRWWLIGMGAILSCVVILGFYSDVAGWVFAYIFKSALGDAATADPDTAWRTFSRLTGDPLASLGWQWGVLILTGAIIMRGASKGIEKVTRVLMPLLFLLLLGICLRSLTLPGAGEGLRFLFMPQWERISGEVILTAMGLAFFKMSVGMGCMLIYGSYFKEDVNIPATALRVMVCDLLVSLLAGMAIFPAVFSFDFEVTQGPALLFMTIPAVFASLPGGHLLATIFFVLSGIAATGAILSLLEVPVSCLAERLSCSRAKAVPAVLAGLMLLGAPATLSLGILNDARMFGMTFFDLYDALSSMLLMPVCGIATCLFVGYSAAGGQVLAHLGDGWTPRAVRQLCRTATPLLILLVLLHGLGLL
ncbi:sodium-dependent transporter [uncultured Desulfovibrio sp.]|uniref:sodium-dependent transporter n=1 Tax=uncultured Desulfovibrio sp. TaxID=167968 RepID=UPI00262BD8A7|nr:sodium-dependent transporter [uncultured Desulfovibrio sp.]